MRQIVNQKIKEVSENCSPYYSLDEEGIATIAMHKKLTIIHQVKNAFQFISNAMNFLFRGFKVANPKFIGKTSYSRIFSLGEERLRQLEEMKDLQMELNPQEYGETTGSGESSDDPMSLEFSDADGNFDFTKFLNAALANSSDPSEENETSGSTEDPSDFDEVFDFSDEDDSDQPSEFSDHSDADDVVEDEANIEDVSSSGFDESPELFKFEDLFKTLESDADSESDDDLPNPSDSGIRFSEEDIDAKPKQPNFSSNGDNDDVTEGSGEEAGHSKKGNLKSR